MSDYVLFAVAYLLGFFTCLGLTYVSVGDIKRENAELNEQLDQLTSRDERGRFNGKRK